MTNKELVERFFDSYSRCDSEEMISYLSSDIFYSDPIYGMISGDTVRSLWRMRCKNLSDFSIQINEYNELDAEYITCKWTGTFVSKRLAKRITVTIKSFMKIENGKITEHSDGYKLSYWLAKAYGLSGLLLGWSGWMKKREQNRYRLMLDKFIENENLFSGFSRREHDYDFSDR